MITYWKTFFFYPAIGMMMPLLLCLIGNSLGWHSENDVYDWNLLPERFVTFGLFFLVIGWFCAERGKRLKKSGIVRSSTSVTD